MEEEEGAEAPLNCSGAHLDSSPSVSDEDEDAGGGRLRPSPGLRVAGGTVCLGKAASPGKQARTVHGGQAQALDGLRRMCRDGNNLPSPSGWDLHIELAAPQGTREPLGTERREPGKITNQIAPHQDDYLGGAGSPGHSLMADGTCEALSLCWQEGSRLDLVPSLDVGLAELASLQGQQGLEKQVLGLQKEQQIGSLGLLAQGKELLALPQEGSSGVMWGDDRGPLIVQSYEQNFSSRTAEDKYEDGASFSPGLWLSSEMDAISLELPLQIEEVLENFHDGQCAPEHQGGCQALGSRSDISLGPGETTAYGDVGSSAVHCGGTDTTAALEEKNYSLALRPKEQSPETLQDSSDLWAEGCPPLLGSSIDASTLVSKETLPPSHQGNIFILGTQDASSFPEASQEAGNRGSSISLLETTGHSNIPDARDGCGLQLGVSGDTCPLHFNSYDCQQEGREDTDLLNPKDLVPLAGNRESYAHRTPKSTSPRSLGRTSRRWGARDALVLKASSVSETRGSAGRAKRKKEDEELSRVAYLLASKLSLSPRQTSLSPHPASGLSSTGQGVQRASSPLSPEARGLGQSPRPVAKSRKQALVTGPVPAEKRPYLGAELAVSGEKPLARPSQPRKRRRDSLGTGRRKKRRRSQ